MFGRGDEVFYAGDITRPGGNAEFHLVDERIVGHKPRSLGWAEAAALPLTSITAWEALFDRLDVSRSVPGANSLLIIGGAGGVGSIAVQLARRLTDLEVIATASGRDAREWVAELGAHHVIDHTKPLSAEIKAAGLRGTWLRVLDEPHRCSPDRDNPAHRPAGPSRLDRRSPDVRRRAAQKQGGLHTLGAHVCAVDAQDCRHGRASASPR